MDLKKLKSIIRFSVRQKILEEDRKKRRPLETFSEFKTAMYDALLREGFEEDLLDDSSDIVFEKIHEAWGCISDEISLLSGEEKVKAWNDSVTFYVTEAVMGINSELNSATDARKTTKNVVSSLLR